jgi:DNA-binding MarR family transcriptional regulator
MQATVASPQQVSEALAHVWAHLTRRSSADLFQVIADVDASFSQVKTLFLLEERPELFVKDIATGLGLSLPAASRAVDGLLQRGYVTRRECAEDRRSRIVALSARGRVVVDRLVEARLAALEAFAADLSEAERTALHSALLPIVERIRRP